MGPTTQDPEFLQPQTKSRLCWPAAAEAVGGAPRPARSLAATHCPLCNGETRRLSDQSLLKGWVSPGPGLSRFLGPGPRQGVKSGLGDGGPPPPRHSHGGLSLCSIHRHVQVLRFKRRECNSIGSNTICCWKEEGHFRGGWASAARLTARPRS